jgi:hypothetical protein
MTKRLTPKAFIRLINDLQHQEEAHRQEIGGSELDQPMELLRSWQARRLQVTYADLLVDPAYQSACAFFLSDIYAAKDFSQRDHDAERLYEILSRYLPEAMLHLLRDTIHLNQLSQQLDQDLLRALVEKLGMTTEISAEMYAEGYRVCNNFRERKDQIEFLTEILSEAAEGAHNPVLVISLRLARGPAQRAGWGELHDFLERGYQASRPMKDVDYFVHTIQQREMAILERIFAGDLQPFRQ